MQSNKIKYISCFVSLIHGVDSKACFTRSTMKEEDKQGDSLSASGIHWRRDQVWFFTGKLRILHGEVTSELPFVEIWFDGNGNVYR